MNGSIPAGSTMDKLKVLEPLLDAETNIVILACNTGGGHHENGIAFTQKIANRLQVPVYANRSFSPSGDIFNTNWLFTFYFGMTYQHGGTPSNDDEENKPNASVNLGYWLVAKPMMKVGNSYKTGLNVAQINALYLKSDGTFGISVIDRNAVYWTNRQLSTGVGKADFIKTYNKNHPYRQIELHSF